MTELKERVKKLEALVVQAQAEIERLDKELAKTKDNWHVEELNHADTLTRLDALREVAVNFLSNTGNVIENKWLQELRVIINGK